MSRLTRGRGDESGFTLVELIAVIGILSIISFPLTEAFIVGLRTTDDNATNMARSVSVQTLSSLFTADVQSAERVSPKPRCGPPGSGDLFLHLYLTAEDNPREVWYSLQADSPPVDGERELIRWSCTTGGALDRRMLGLLTVDSGNPVEAKCQLVTEAGPPAFTSCPADPVGPADPNNPKDPAKGSEFEAVKLTVQAPEPVELIVRRRTG